MNEPRTLTMLQALIRCRERQPVPRDATPFKTVLCDGPFSLRHYHAPDAPPRGHPLLIVYSTINRPDLLDLTERRSMIRLLLEAGFDVYLVDWGYPVDADSLLDLEDYLDGFLHQAVIHVSEQNDDQAVDALGICQGGTLLTCYAALHPDRVRSLVNLGTPLDFGTETTALTRLADAQRPTETPGGNISGRTLSAAFAALRPTDLLVRRYDALPRIAADTGMLDEFLVMEAWMYDCPDQPEVMFWRFLTRFYQDNALVEGTLRIGERPVLLENITARVLNIHAEDDHLVPPRSTRAAMSNARQEDVSCRGGHLGLFLSRQTRQRVVPAIVDWICHDTSDTKSFD